MNFNVGRNDQIFPEYTNKEFPKRCIKKTYTEPPIQWSYHPRHDTAAYLMSRKDILEEASSEELKYLKAIMNNDSIFKNTHNFKNETGIIFLCL